MPTTCLTQELQGKHIISVTDGSIIAKVLDVLVDPDALQVAAAVTAKGGGLLKREVELDVIPADDVQVWGRDVVLVKGPDVIVKDSQLSGSQAWLSVSGQVKGRDVVGDDGTRVGQLNDVVIDVDGQFVGYDLAQPFVPGGDPAQKMKQIPAEATSVLGQDVLILDMDRLRAALPAEALSQVEDLPAEEDLPQAEVLPEVGGDQPGASDSSGQL
jgi:sporulation protein YlmC with PRC-barrel domain